MLPTSGSFVFLPPAIQSHHINQLRRMRPALLILAALPLCAFLSLCLPQLAVASAPPKPEGGGEVTNSQHLEMATVQLDANDLIVRLRNLRPKARTVSGLSLVSLMRTVLSLPYLGYKVFKLYASAQNGLGSGVVAAAHEAGSKDAIIGPPDVTKAVKEIAIAKEVVLTNKGHDATRLVRRCCRSSCNSPAAADAARCRFPLLMSLLLHPLIPDGLSCCSCCMPVLLL